MTRKEALDFLKNNDFVYLGNTQGLTSTILHYINKNNSAVHTYLCLPLEGGKWGPANGICDISYFEKASSHIGVGEYKEIGVKIRETAEKLYPLLSEDFKDKLIEAHILKESKKSPSKKLSDELSSINLKKVEENLYRDKNTGLYLAFKYVPKGIEEGKEGASHPSLDPLKEEQYCVCDLWDVEYKTSIMEGTLDKYAERELKEALTLIRTVTSETDIPLMDDFRSRFWKTVQEMSYLHWTREMDRLRDELENEEGREGL